MLFDHMKKQINVVLMIIVILGCPIKYEKYRSLKDETNNNLCTKFVHKH